MPIAACPDLAGDAVPARRPRNNHHPAYANRRTFPTAWVRRSHFSLVAQSLLAGASEPIEPCAPVVGGGLPLGGDPTSLLHAVECRIQRPFFNPQAIVGDLLNVRGSGSLAPADRGCPEEGQTPCKGSDPLWFFYVQGNRRPIVLLLKEPTMADPRVYQIAMLASLLVYGM